MNISNSYYGLVIFVDLLGTKGIWKRNDPLDVITKYTDMINTINDLIHEDNRRFVENRIDIKYQMYYFSDTIIVTAKVPIGYKNNIAKLLIDLGGTFQIFMTKSLLDGLYFRGCISAGNYYTDNKTLIIGPAIDEAAEYYTLPQWVGISAAPSAYNILNDYIKQNTSIDFWSRHDLPMGKGFEDNAWVIRWQSSKQKEIIKAILHQIENNVEFKNILKWRNTLEFVQKNLK